MNDFGFIVEYDNALEKPLTAISDGLAGPAKD